MELNGGSTLKWNRHGENILESLRDMRNNKQMLDMTLVHKLVLSACSSFFCQVISENSHTQTLINLGGVKFCQLAPLLDFMYLGEVYVMPCDLTEFLELAQDLKVKGLIQIAPADIITTISSSTIFVNIKKLSEQEEQQIHKQEASVAMAVNDNVVEDYIIAMTETDKLVGDNSIGMTEDNTVEGNGIATTENDNLVEDTSTTITETGSTNLVKDNVITIAEIDGRVKVTEKSISIAEVSKKDEGSSTMIIEKYSLHERSSFGLADSDNLTEKSHCEMIEVEGYNQIPHIRKANTDNQMGLLNNDVIKQTERRNEGSQNPNDKKSNSGEIFGFNVDSEKCRVISFKMVKLGVKELRRHFCQDCGKIGSKTKIFNHIAVKHLGTNLQDTHQDSAGNCPGIGKESNKIKNPLDEEESMDLKGFDDVLKPVVSQFKGKPAGSKLSGNNMAWSLKDVNSIPLKKKKIVKFTSNVAGYDNYYTPDCPTHSKDIIEDLDALKFLRVGIISATKRGFVYQDEPEKFVDI